MKILHCCLANYYIDNYGYQENVLTRVHKLQGYDVQILASTESLDKEKGIVYLNPGSYITEDGIPITRLPYKTLLCKSVSRKVRMYPGVKDFIEKFSPDIIFMHDGQTAAVFPIVSYIKEHPRVRLYIDSHTDFVNSARTWISRYILHGVLYKVYIKHTIPYVSKYYGTLPARVQFYTEVYKTPKDKTEYLPMGIDDLSVDFNHRQAIRDCVRKKLSIKEEDFVFITGGKIDSLKNIHVLLEAFHRIDNPNMKIIVFGAVQNDIRDSIQHLFNVDSRIIPLGWVSSKETYRYFFASDFACFPGTHSTLWEESVGYGIPAMFKYWDGITQVDQNGNCFIIKDVSVDSIQKLILQITIDKDLYNRMNTRALSSEVMDYFAYSKIAKKAIEQ